MVRWSELIVLRGLLFKMCEVLLVSKFRLLTIRWFFFQHRGKRDKTKRMTPLHIAHKKNTFHNYLQVLSHLRPGISVRLSSFVRVSSGSVKRLRSTLGCHTGCVCASLACGREEGIGWACSEGTLWEEGWAAGCECFGSSETPARSSDSGRSRG